MSIFTEADFAITTLLQCEMNSGREQAEIRILPRRQRVQRVAPAAAANANRKADPAYPSPELLRCRRDCCAPSRRCRACVLRALRTSENRHPAHGHER